jgi:hypothetical protein
MRNRLLMLGKRGAPLIAVFLLGVIWFAFSTRNTGSRWGHSTYASHELKAEAMLAAPEVRCASACHARSPSVGRTLTISPLPAHASK